MLQIKSQTITPIQNAILNLFHALWLKQKTILLKELMGIKNFWSMVAHSVFCKPEKNNGIYANIFNIILYVTYTTRGRIQEIDMVFDKMFADSTDFVKMWTSHIMDSLTEPTTMTDGIYILMSWRNLIITAQKYHPKCLQNSVVQILAENCINGLIQCYPWPNNIRICQIWTELYLFLITNCKSASYQERTSLDVLTKIYEQLIVDYFSMSHTCKKYFMSIAINTIKYFGLNIEDNIFDIEKFLYLIGLIFQMEFKDVTTAYTGNDANEYVIWHLLLIFGNVLLKMKFQEVLPRWFIQTRFVYSIVTAIRPFLKNQVLFPLAKESIHCLLNCADSQLIEDFLYVDIDLLFSDIEPPLHIYNTKEINSQVNL